ncbi:MAG: hypothetical protein M1826_006853 [Phylliscum demangeonii]|nr:MAG: hypothetical protein M1826_006853 [Phylliscum demangeonii]
MRRAARSALRAAPSSALGLTPRRRPTPSFPPLSAFLCPYSGPRRAGTRPSPSPSHHHHQQRPITTPTPPPPATPPPSTPTPTPTPTHYDLFPHTLPHGPPPHGPFRVNNRLLHQEFLRLQGGAHPDRHAAGGKRRAEAASAAINEAYKTLGDALLRAQYVLALAGRGVDDERARVDDGPLLAAVMEAREQVEEAQCEADLGGGGDG